MLQTETNSKETREIFQWFRALASFADDPGSIPSTQTAVYYFTTAVIWGPMVLPFMITRHIHGAQPYMKENIHTQKINI